MKIGIGIGMDLVSGQAIAPDNGPTIIEVDTTITEAGSSNSDQFSLFLRGGTYNFELDWGDGNTSTITTDGTHTHTYSTGGVYQVKINTNKGTFSGGFFVLNSASRDRKKYTDVLQWGVSNTFTGMSSSFYGCSNLDISATDSWDMSNLGTVKGNNCFRDCTSLTAGPEITFSGGSINSLEGLFRGCSSLASIPAYSGFPAGMASWLASFRDCTSLTEIPAGLELSTATVGAGTFRGCSNLTTFNPTDLSKFTSMGEFFQDCSSLTTFGGTLDISGATTLDAMFWGCSSLTTSPINSIKSTATSINSIFYNCSGLTTLPAFDFSNVTNFARAFFGCTGLNSFDFSTFDFSAMTNGTSMFAGVTLDTSIYDQLLIDLDNDNANTGVTFHGGNSLYTKSPSSAETARSNLLARAPAWSITDGGPTP